MTHAVFQHMADAGLIDAEDIPRLRTREAEGAAMDDVLRQINRADESQLLQFFADEFSLSVIDIDSANPDRALVGRFPARVLLEHHVLPIADRGDVVQVATARLFDAEALDVLRLAAGKPIELALAPAADIDRKLGELLGVGADTLQRLDSDRQIEGVELVNDGDTEDIDSEAVAEDASIIRFVNQVLVEAIHQRATDVHFEPFESELRVRYRIDGLLVDANVPPSVSRYRAAIVSRLKILSHLDIAEKRLPQDGRIKVKIAGSEIDLRVSIIPMLHGEAVVLRILDRSATLLGLENLGMSARDSQAFEKVLHMPHGVILVTGPTGSGKTTTLYAGLSRINSVDRKIITIEDPVEYQLHGINQIQVSEKTGLTFARGLRSILRHDPDVVLVGEIRDRETAAIAVQASLTGHLVFSTLHTNDAPGAMARLVDMGIEPYLVSSSVELVLAQRLVRLICPDCREAIHIEDITQLRNEFGVEMPDHLYHGRGCRACQDTGYRSREGVFELMVVSETIRSLVMDHASSGKIRAAAMREGMKSLREDGWRLVADGRTTLEEVMRVTKDESSAIKQPEPNGQ